MDVVRGPRVLGVLGGGDAIWEDGGDSSTATTPLCLVRWVTSSLKYISLTS